MKKMNALHPWLPQNYPEPRNNHLNLSKELEKATRRVRRAERNLASVKTEYVRLMERDSGPYTIETITVAASFQRLKIEHRHAKEELRRLLSMKRLRNK